MAFAASVLFAFEVAVFALAFVVDAVRFVAVFAAPVACVFVRFAEDLAAPAFGAAAFVADFAAPEAWVAVALAEPFAPAACEEAERHGWVEEPGVDGEDGAEEDVARV